MKVPIIIVGDIFLCMKCVSNTKMLFISSICHQMAKTFKIFVPHIQGGETSIGSIPFVCMVPLISVKYTILTQIVDNKLGQINQTDTIVQLHIGTQSQVYTEWVTYWGSMSIFGWFDGGTSTEYAQLYPLHIGRTCNPTRTCATENWKTNSEKQQTIDCYLKHI